MSYHIHLKFAYFLFVMPFYVQRLYSVTLQKVFGIININVQSEFKGKKKDIKYVFNVKILLQKVYKRSNCVYKCFSSF